MITTSFRVAKIYWREPGELLRGIDNLHAVRILSVSSGIPEMTTTANCSDVYYEYVL